jgi:hypothetical protein
LRSSSSAPGDALPTATLTGADWSISAYSPPAGAKSILNYRFKG